MVYSFFVTLTIFLLYQDMMKPLPPEIFNTRIGEFRDIKLIVQWWPYWLVYGYAVANAAWCMAFIRGLESEN